MPLKKSIYLDYLVSLCALAFCVYRLFFGCDLTDEGYYIALPWRFVLGDKPFIDEAYILQTAAIPLIPLIKLFSVFSHGTEGIMLFTRFAYFLFTLFTAVVSWEVIRLKWQQFPFIACLLLVLFIPYNTPNLSYNTLGKGFFTLGLVFGLTRLYLERASPFLFFAGVFHGLACFCYPTLGAAAIAFLFVLFFIAEKDKFRLCFIYLAGCLFPLLCIYFLLDAHLKDYVHAFNFTRTAMIKTTGETGISHVLITFSDGLHAIPHPLLLLSTATAFALLSKVVKKSFFIPLLVSFFVLIIRAARPTLGGSGANGTIINLALLSPFLFIGFKPSQAIKQYFLLVFIPSLVGALAMACTSGNGWNASALLFTNGVMFALVFIYERLTQFKDYVVISLSILLLAVLMRYELSAMPDGSRQDMTERLTSGPYKGIYTSPEKAAYYAELSKLLQQHENKNGRLLVIPHLPGAYLFSKMPPASLNIWGGCSKAAPIECENYFEKNFKTENITLKVKQLLMSKDVKVDFSTDENPLDKLILEKQVKKEETSHFVLFGSNQ